jgi:predicted ATPase
LATQSPRLVDEFDTDDIIVAERIENENRTTFKKLDSQKLADWLENYSLSELWEKNVLGGQP